MSNELARIVGNLRSLADYLENEELTPQLESLLTINRAELAEKVSSFHQVIIKAEANIEMGKREKTRIDEFIKVQKRTVARLEFALLTALTTLGRKDGDVYRLDVGTLRLSTRKSSGIVVTDQSEIPVNYLRYPKPEPDLTAIKAAIDKGEQVPGAYKEDRDNLVIK